MEVKLDQAFNTVKSNKAPEICWITCECFKISTDENFKRINIYWDFSR